MAVNVDSDGNFAFDNSIFISYTGESLTADSYLLASNYLSTGTIFESFKETQVISVDDTGLSADTTSSDILSAVEFPNQAIVTNKAGKTQSYIFFAKLVDADHTYDTSAD
jgi:hypothetical protein